MTLVSSVVSEIVGGGHWPPLAVRVTKISVAVRVLICLGLINLFVIIINAKNS